MSKYFKGYDVFEGRATEIYRKNPNRSKVARILWKEVSEEYEEKGLTEASLYSWVRRFIDRLSIIDTKKDLDESEESRNENSKTPKEAFMPSAWDPKLDKFLSLDEYCDRYNLPKELAVGARLVSHNAGHMIYNIGFKNFEPGEDSYSIPQIIEEAIEKHSKPVETKISGVIKSSHDFARVIYSDVHVGMNPNQDGRSLYGGVWNKEELFNCLSIFVGEILMNAKSKTLYVDELGDFLDGYDGETVRKGHHLPQNMNNREQFDNGVEFKVMLADLLAPHFDKIVFNNICEDNHAGDFGYITNQTSKHIIEAKHKHVEVINHEKFINHYIVGRHAFVISHGKDSKNLKFGFKPHLDPKQIEKIDQYLKENNIYRDADFIEFSKGDSHQMLLDFCTSDDFDYFNYPAFSCSSNWVQTNFKKGRSGFVIQNIHNDIREKEFTPFFFNWKKQ